MVYVPSYDPAVVYGDLRHIPIIRYTYPGYYPGMGLAWGAAGFALGALGRQQLGRCCDWNNGDININNNNNYVNRNSNRNVNQGNKNWQHDPSIGQCAVRK